ncbi:MAG: hypothetical protein HQM08_23265 [Candidatus Riflebacteria bacterium]|nr:hypothetical protein [Candidatus Riflebacteria bacterium]
MRTKLNLKVVSLILGIVLWLYVNLILSPTVRRTVKANVEFRNLPALMKVTPDKVEAEAVLTGTRRDFIISGPDYVQLGVDLYSIRPGTADFPVKVMVIPPGLSVVSVRPNQLELKAEALTQRVMDVEVEIKGQTSEGFIAEPPIVKPRQITIEGPPGIVKTITTCQVSINLADVKNSVSEKRPIVLFSSEGEVTDGVKIDPDKVMVDVPVKAGFPSRAVAVAPNFINKLPEGWKLDSFKVIPNLITISGPARVLDELNEIRASPIDLSQLASSTSTVTVSVASPRENLSIVGSPTVAFEFKLTSAPVTRLFQGIPLSISCNPGRQCIVTPASYSLLLQGRKKSLDTISPSDLVVPLDAKDRAPGSYTVPLSCPKGLPKDVAIIEFTPSQVQVSIIPSISSSSEGIKIPKN